MSNGLTARPDTSILYSRIAILIAIYGTISCYTNFNVYSSLIPYDMHSVVGTSLYGGLFNVTPIFISLQIFILTVSGLILHLTAFEPKKDDTSINELDYVDQIDDQKGMRFNSFFLSLTLLGLY